jgi:dihydroorotate dehydrogenase (fumarate)
MNLTTRYLGIDLLHPLLPGASPLVDDRDTVLRLIDAGAPAIVMHSLFEEQLTLEQLAALRHIDGHNESFGEASTFFPDSNVFAIGPDAYLNRIRQIREQTGVPVIGSLNGTTRGGWLRFAREIEQAGANALELNLFSVPTDPSRSGEDVERSQVEIVEEVVKTISIPVSVKLVQTYSSLPHFVTKLERAGAKGIVLFNRWVLPDINVENLEIERVLRLSDSSELPIRLRWLAILSPITKMSLSASGGVHDGLDALKAIMAGADSVQIVSALLKRGPETFKFILRELRDWLLEHEYESLAQARGSMNHARCPNPSGYERANYIQTLQAWHGEHAWHPHS